MPAQDRARAGDGAARAPAATLSACSCTPTSTSPPPRALVPYLHRLGIGDGYISPLLQARAGSRHGYDVVDHDAISADLGGAAGFDDLAAALGAHGMGLIVDFVPNHMGICPRANAWWRDVLENGPCSPYARCFDIDWRPVKDELHDKVLLPILGDQYGLVLERGELRLAYADGRFTLRYFDHELPINPRQVPRDPRRRTATSTRRGDDAPDLAEYRSILTALRNLPAYTETEPDRMAERQREKEVARDRLARLVARAPRVARHVEALRRRLQRPGRAPSACTRCSRRSPIAWPTGAPPPHEINYRRFFDINELAGLRMEDPEVFAAAHGLPARAGRRRPGDRPAPRPHRRPVRSGRLPGDAAARAPRAAGAAAPVRSRWSRRSSAATSRCPPPGRSPAPPATTSSTTATACSSIAATSASCSASTGASPPSAPASPTSSTRARS